VQTLLGTQPGRRRARAGFAMLEAVVVLASVLQRFRLAPVPGAAFPAAEPRITLRPAAVELIVDPR